jgi:hypothetical protein
MEEHKIPGEREDEAALEPSSEDIGQDLTYCPIRWQDTQPCATCSLVRGSGDLVFNPLLIGHFDSKVTLTHRRGKADFLGGGVRHWTVISRLPRSHM